MFYILFFVSYIFASNDLSAGHEIAGACVAIHEHLMEVDGCFLDGRPLTVHSPVTDDRLRKYYPNSENMCKCIPMANQIKSILCKKFFNVSKSKLPKRIEACMKALDANLEFMSSFDTAETAAMHLIQDAKEELLSIEESQFTEKDLLEHVRMKSLIHIEEANLGENSHIQMAQEASIDQLTEEGCMKSLLLEDKLVNLEDANEKLTTKEDNLKSLPQTESNCDLCYIL